MANLTKKAIAASVTRLLEKKPLDKITIREITDDCGMTRNTFYYHFQDIYDLCSWIFVAEAEDIVSRCRQEDQKLGQLLLEGLEYLYEHRKMIRHVYDSINRDDLAGYLKQVIYRYARELIDPYVQDDTISTDARDLAAEFYQNAFVARVLQWIDDGMDMPPEKLAYMCECMFRGTIGGALESTQKITEDFKK